MDNQKERITIAYGDKNTTINKGNEHLFLDDEELAFIVQSIIKNKTLKITIIN